MAAEPDTELDGRTLCERYAERLAARHSIRPDSKDLEKAKLCLIDFLACALESRTLPWSRQAIALAESASASTRFGAAGIVGTTLRASLAEAAFANAVLGHGLVRDDMHLGSVSHLGVVVMPTVLALAEQRPVSGRDLLAAIVAGYETGGSFGRTVLDVEVSRIHRPTGITGPIAAAAAGGVLLEMDANELASALALAANTIAGYNEWAATGGSEMFFHPGFAARNALGSIALARAGAYASATALDGAAGALAAFAKLPDSETPLPFAGTSEIQAVFFKEVPACNFAQSAAQAARDIAVAEPVPIDAVDRIVARVSYAAANYPGCDSAGPFEHILQAKMSIQYNVAAALACGHFDEANYSPQDRPEITALAARVSVEIDEEATRAFPGRQAARVIVHRKDGSTVARDANDVIPASNDLVRERLINAGTETIGRGNTDALLSFIADMDDKDDAGRVVRLSMVSS